MRGSLLALATALVVFTVLTLSAFGKSNSVINITQTQIRHTGQGQVGVGSIDRWVYLLYNRRITMSAIGYSLLTCTYAGSGGPLGSGVSDCTATYSLAKGKIVARGLLKERSFYQLAVVGGTGFYSGMAGQMLSSTFAFKPHEERLIFSLEE